MFKVNFGFLSRFREFCVRNSSLCATLTWQREMTRARSLAGSGTLGILLFMAKRTSCILDGGGWGDDGLWAGLNSSYELFSNEIKQIKM